MDDKVRPLEYEQQRPRPQPIRFWFALAFAVASILVVLFGVVLLLFG